MVGRVIEVFIPEEYKNNELIDVMASNKIGFQVMLDEDKVITVVMEQDEYNTGIFREDLVKVIFDDVTNEYISIELYDGEDYE